MIKTKDAVWKSQEEASLLFEYENTFKYLFKRKENSLQWHCWKSLGEHKVMLACITGIWRGQQNFESYRKQQKQSEAPTTQLKQVGRHSKIKRVGRRKLEPRREKPHPPKPLRGHFWKESLCWDGTNNVMTAMWHRQHRHLHAPETSKSRFLQRPLEDLNVKPHLRPPAQVRLPMEHWHQRSEQRGLEAFLQHSNYSLCTVH